MLSVEIVLSARVRDFDSAVDLIITARDSSRTPSSLGGWPHRKYVIDPAYVGTHMTKDSARENGIDLPGCSLRNFERYSW